MRLRLFTLTLLLLTITPLTFPKTITIPDEAESIERAIELAASGDTVLIKSATVPWSYSSNQTQFGDILDPSAVNIRDVSLTIRGHSAENKSEIVTSGPYDATSANRAMLKLDNASITFENLLMQRPPALYYPPEWGANGGPTGAIMFIAENASLSLTNCAFTVGIECLGNLTLLDTVLKGHAWLSGYAYNIHETLVPTILLGPSNGGECKIIDSTISSDSDVAYRCIIANEYNNSKFTFENAKIYGGTYTVGYGSFTGDYIVGSDALAIHDSQNVSLNMLYSTLQAGHGYDSRHHRFGIWQGGGQGGSAISLHNSTADLSIKHSHNYYIHSYSNLFGGEGGDGTASYDRSLSDIITIDGGDGGSGLKLQNSTIRLVEGELKDLAVKSGRGGGDMLFNNQYSQPGQPGNPIDMDDSSHILGQTKIDLWNLH